MARKGSSKVRTGCFTCKVRKVKCDETKPECKRCASTGRKCDGYPAGALVSFYRPGVLFQSFNQQEEVRSLQFFCEVAAPSLAHPFDPFFWKNLVLQFSNFEPAVRHSLIAISSIYEDFTCKSKSVQALAKNPFAINHYNAAIQKLKDVANEPLVLLVCLLFVCIETLQGNREAAMNHARHGIEIFSHTQNAFPWTRDHLGPLFRRLSVVPLFFGQETFPQSPGLDEPIPDEFSSFTEAEYFMEGLLGQTIRLVRCGDEYRHGRMMGQPMPATLMEVRRNLVDALDSWETTFAKVEVPSDRQAGHICVRIRLEICRIWPTIAFEPDEMPYDDFLETFRYVTRLAEDMGKTMQAESRSSVQGPRFRFEMGFLPLVFFVVMKCRDLRVRLHALYLMREYATARENFWETDKMTPIAHRLIEIEHGIILNAQGEPVGDVDYDHVPPEEMRVRDFGSNPNDAVQLDIRGKPVTGRVAGFIMRSKEGEIYIRNEFIAPDDDADGRHQFNPPDESLVNPSVYLSEYITRKKIIHH